MMAVATAVEFVAVLEKSRLLAAREVAFVRDSVARSSSEPSGRKLAKILVKRGFVTRWQAEQLLVGNADFYLGKYKLLDRIGKGGMGTVYKAQHAVMGRTVALKVMAKELIKDPQAVARFRREVKSAAALNHPNIVTAHDADCVGDTHFLVMEYVEGRDLTQWIRDFVRLPIPWSCECIRQAALGLDHAHQRGLVHRDIKPANLLVTVNDLDALPKVKILDMGLARFVSELQGDGSITRSGQIVGTPDYIAPEQADDVKTADIRADVYSLGCTLFHMLTGQVPFQGPSVMARLMARLNEEAPRLSSLRPDASPQLDAIVAKMLATEPADRYQTPAEVAAAMEPLAANAADDSADVLAAIPKTRPPGSSSIIRSDSDLELEGFLKGLVTANVSDPANTETPAGGGATLPTPLVMTEARITNVSRPKPSAPVTTKVRPLVSIGALAIVVVALVLAWPYLAPDKEPQQKRATAAKGSATQRSSAAGGTNPVSKVGKEKSPADKAATGDEAGDQTGDESAGEPTSDPASSDAAIPEVAIPETETSEAGIADDDSSDTAASGEGGSAADSTERQPTRWIVSPKKDDLPDLATALQKASAGDTIVIRHQGPLELDPIHLTGKTPLTIVGDGTGDGDYWPLVRQAEKAPAAGAAPPPAADPAANDATAQQEPPPPTALFQGKKLDLTLQKLHLAVGGPSRAPLASVFSLAEGTIHLEDCTVTVGVEGRPGEPSGAALPLIQTTSNESQHVAIVLERSLIRGLRLEGCLQSAGGGDLNVTAEQTMWAAGAAPWLSVRDLAGRLHVSLTACTLYNVPSLLRWDAAEQASEADKPKIEVDASQTVFVGGRASKEPFLQFHPDDPQANLATAATAGVVRWQGGGNAYFRYPGGYFKETRRKGAGTFDQWRKLWKLTAGNADREADPMFRVWPEGYVLEEVSALDLEPRFLKKSGDQAPGADHSLLPPTLWSVFAVRDIAPEFAGRPRRAPRILRVHQKEGPFKTIEDAVDDAKDGDVIEIADQGPYIPKRNFDISQDKGVLVLRQRQLTIRGSDSVVPIIVLSDDAQEGKLPELLKNKVGQLFLIASQGDTLHLEGLHFRIQTSIDSLRAIAHVENGTFRCTNCSFLDLTPGQPAEIHNNETVRFIHRAESARLTWFENDVFCYRDRRLLSTVDATAPTAPANELPPESSDALVRLDGVGGLLRMRNCLFGDAGCACATGWNPLKLPLSLELDHCTVIGQVGMFTAASPPASMYCIDNLVVAPRTPMTIDAPIGGNQMARTGSNNSLWAGTEAFDAQERGKGVNANLPGPLLKSRPQPEGKSTLGDPLRMYHVKRPHTALTMASDGKATGVRFEYLPKLPALPPEFFPAR